MQLFVGAVNQKMFPRPADRRCTSSAWIIDSSADLAGIRQVWRLHIEEADLAALRVLANLLAFRGPSIRSRFGPRRPPPRSGDWIP